MIADETAAASTDSDNNNNIQFHPIEKTKSSFIQGEERDREYYGGRSGGGALSDDENSDDDFDLDDDNDNELSYFRERRMAELKQQ